MKLVPYPQRSRENADVVWALKYCCFRKFSKCGLLRAQLEPVYRRNGGMARIKKHSHLWYTLRTFIVIETFICKKRWNNPPPLHHTESLLDRFAANYDLLDDAFAPAFGSCRPNEQIHLAPQLEAFRWMPQQPWGTFENPFQARLVVRLGRDTKEFSGRHPLSPWYPLALGVC